MDFPDWIPRGLYVYYKSIPSSYPQFNAKHPNFEKEQQEIVRRLLTSEKLKAMWLQAQNRMIELNMDRYYWYSFINFILDAHKESYDSSINKTTKQWQAIYQQVENLAKKLSEKIKETELDHTLLYWVEDEPPWIREDIEQGRALDLEPMQQYRAMFPLLSNTLLMVSEEAQRLNKSIETTERKDRGFRVKIFIQKLAEAFLEMFGLCMQGSIAAIARIVFEDDSISKDVTVKNALKGIKCKQV